MHVAITYSLSEKGRKASILAGGDGRQIQTVQVEQGGEHFAAALDQATVGSDGAAKICLQNERPFDVLPTTEQLLAVLPAVQAVQAEKRAAEERQAAERREATLAVLRDRKVKVSWRGQVGDAKFEHLSADWPWNGDEEVKKFPEAVAWEAELQAFRGLVDAAYARAKADVDEKAKADKAAANAAVAFWRAEHGLAEGDRVFRVEEGCLASVPVWESHSRGRNWLATITSDPKKPGGLERNFAAKCRGDLYYVVPAWQPGDAVEFGADYYSGSGRKSAKRWYGHFVRQFASTSKSPSGHEAGTTYVVLRQSETGKEAIKAGAKAKAEAKS